VIPRFTASGPRSLPRESVLIHLSTIRLSTPTFQSALTLRSCFPAKSSNAIIRATCTSPILTYLANGTSYESIHPSVFSILLLFLLLGLDMYPIPYVEHSSNRVEVRQATFCQQQVDDTSLLSC
jgi:hypothetical protein